MANAHVRITHVINTCTGALVHVLTNYAGERLLTNYGELKRESMIESNVSQLTAANGGEAWVVDNG